MSQVIIYTNEYGNVSVCFPTGEIPIEEVLTKDCPAGALIVDDSTLPQGSDAQFQGAWRLNNGIITVDMDAAKAIYLISYNNQATNYAGIRATNTLAGIDNIVPDSVWLNAVNAGRNLISTTTNTDQLLAIPMPTVDG